MSKIKDLSTEITQFETLKEKYNEKHRAKNLRPAGQDLQDSIDRSNIRIMKIPV